MRCTNCEFENPAGMKFCGKCRTALGLTCPNCSFENPPGFDFCGQCTTALHGAAGITQGEPAAAKPAVVAVRVVAEEASPMPEGERKIVTALFADIKGSTALMEGLDPEAAHAIVAPLLRIMTDVVQRYEGYVARTTGDGIFALFGAPIAFEDHPQRALYAALEMQQELRADAQRRTTKGMRSLEARLGVHTGEMVAYFVETSGKVEYRLIGHTANLASRIESSTPVGSIATSDYTRQLCEGYFEFRALGPTEMKGLSAPIEVYEVIGPGPLRTHFQVAVQRGLTKFVGREHELAQVRRALEQAISGHGQVVAVMAEAGTGKSRLFHEFKATIPPTCKVLEAYSVSHGKASAWLPVLELLRGYFRIQDADDAAARRAKMSNALTALDPALEDTLPYLFGLFGIVEGPDPLAQMDPQIKRQRTLDAIKRIILRESLKQPVVVIFEDLHWIDAQTQALLDVLANSIASSRVLLLCNYRPEYRHEWTNKSYYTQLRLDPLDGADGAAMLAALLGEGVELNPLKRLIADRTGGNPFFVEEIVQALFDEGALTRNGAVKITRSLSQLRLPQTVQGMLAARIGRLSTEQKDLLQTLAVIGRESSLGQLRQVASDAETQLERMLADLQAGEFIYEQPVASDIEFVFKHALTQEVAYNSLLIERRKQLHERAGQALESLFADQLDDHLSQLAHHYSHSNNADKAIEYLGRAGQQAMQRSAHQDAIGNLTAAIDLVQRLPESPERDQRELMLQLPLSQALQVVRGFSAEEVNHAFTRARDLCGRLGDPPELFDVLYGIVSVHLLRGERREAERLAKELLAKTEDAHDSSQLVGGHASVGAILFEFGQYLPVRKHLETAILFYERGRQKGLSGDYRLISALSYLGLTLNILGYADQARERGDQAVALGREFGPFTLAFAMHFRSFVLGDRREARAAQNMAERVIELSTEHGFAFWLAQATSVRGEALAEQGRLEEGVVDMLRGLAAMRAIGFEANRPIHLAKLAKAYGAAGRLDEALGTLQEATAIAREMEERKFDSVRLHLQGELLLKQSGVPAAEAELCFERAIEVARSQGAKWFELSATTSLARLLAKQGDREKARTMLAEIYNWFTEGFDTADLIDARALLDELGT
jgi:class 3 adenylate cyclase/tetratricopeptide (TPR) repeat protein